MLVRQQAKSKSWRLHKGLQLSGLDAAVGESRSKGSHNGLRIPFSEAEQLHPDHRTDLASPAYSALLHFVLIDTESQLSFVVKVGVRSLVRLYS